LNFKLWRQFRVKRNKQANNKWTQCNRMLRYNILIYTWRIINSETDNVSWWRNFRNFSITSGSRMIFAISLQVDNVSATVCGLFAFTKRLSSFLDLSQNLFWWSHECFQFVVVASNRRKSFLALQAREGCLVAKCRFSLLGTKFLSHTRYTGMDHIALSHQKNRKTIIKILLTHHFSFFPGSLLSHLVPELQGEVYLRMNLSVM
jgi:hypothetical protein